MACCFGRRSARESSSDHDVYLYPAGADGDVLLQVRCARTIAVVTLADNARRSMAAP